MAIPAALAGIDGPPFQLLRIERHELAGGALGGVVVFEGTPPALIYQRGNHRGEHAPHKEQAQGGDYRECCAVIGFAQHRIPPYAAAALPPEAREPIAVAMML